LFVKYLSLKNFRNYESLTMEFDEGINLLYGSNAQGKTNVLEAVYLAGTTKSHRGTKDRDMIRMGEEESHIRMLLDRNANEYRVDIHLRKNRSKGAAINGLPVRKAAELYSITSFVFFSPEDLGIIKNGPAGRRKFLDVILSGTDMLYLSDLTKYGKILSQRNALLHDLSFHPDRMGELDIWDLELIGTGKRLIEKRNSFIETFGEIASAKHEILTEGKERLNITYEPNTGADQLETKTARNRDADIRTRETHAGPHRDDLCIRVNGMDLRVYGSQGQQRTAALSMKMAEIDMIERMKGIKPVLLLDDVLSELDADRQNALLKGIHDTQTMITCTGLDDFVSRTLGADRIFHVKDGSVTAQSFV
jgi:DNA replication and repair protein RecF